MLEKPKQIHNVVALREYQDAKERLLSQWLSFDIVSNASGTNMMCKVCRRVGYVAFPFIPFSIWTEYNNRGKMMARTKILKNKKEAIDHFQQEHWEGCIKFKG